MSHTMTSRMFPSATRLLAVLESFSGVPDRQVATLKDVGMVATHCAVMCGLSVHALRCALLLVSLVFGELFFGESPSLHDLFLHFLAKCNIIERRWGVQDRLEEIKMPKYLKEETLHLQARQPVYMY